MASNYSYTNANLNSADYRLNQRRTTLTTEQRIKLMRKWLEEHKDFAWCESYRQYAAELKALEGQA
jgi:hypothetical protein